MHRKRKKGIKGKNKRVKFQRGRILPHEYVSWKNVLLKFNLLSIILELLKNRRENK